MKRFFQTKLILLLPLTMILLVGMIVTGCKNGGIKKGFDFEGMRSGLSIAIKTKQSVFEIDNITVEGYYGFEDSYSFLISENQPYEFTALVLYFCNESDLRNVRSVQGSIGDYHMIEGYHFMKELSLSELDPDEYLVTQNFFTGKKFSHSETFIVPKEIIIGEQGEFCFVMLTILKSKIDGNYTFRDMEQVDVKYVLKEGNKIHLE